MTAIRTIVVACDCSEASSRALRYADGIAARSGAEIVAVYGAPISARVEGVGVAAAFACRDHRAQEMLPLRHCVEAALAAALSPPTPGTLLLPHPTPSDPLITSAQ